MTERPEVRTLAETRADGGRLRPCPPCTAAQELIRANDACRTNAAGGVLNRNHWQRYRAAEAAWDAAKRLRHTCRDRIQEEAA